MRSFLLASLGLSPSHFLCTQSLNFPFCMTTYIVSVWLSSVASNQGWWVNTSGRRLQEIQRPHGLYQKAGNARLNTSHFPNPRPPPASRTVRAPSGPGAWLRLVDPCSGLAPRGRPPANQARGRCPGAKPPPPGWCAPDWRRP